MAPRTPLSPRTYALFPCTTPVRSIADAEGVVLALLALGERRHAVLVLDGVDRVAGAGEDRVRVGLVADGPDDAVVGGVVHRVQGDGQFDHAEAGAEMTARLADRFDQVGAQFVGDGGQLGFVELAQVGRGFDARKARVARRVDHVRHFPLRRRDGQGKGTFRTWECPPVRRTTWQRAGDCAESAPERAGYLPRSDEHTSAIQSLMSN